MINVSSSIVEAGGQAGWSLKRISKKKKKRQLCAEIRVFAPKSYGITVPGACGEPRHTKSPEEAAISVGFIKPTKQFNSFVQESSTSLINKSRDIIFSAFLKSLKCQAF